MAGQVILYQPTNIFGAAVIGSPDLGPSAPGVGQYQALQTAIEAAVQGEGIVQSTIINGSGCWIIPGNTSSRMTWPGADALAPDETSAGDFNAELIDLVAMIRAGWVWVDYAPVPLIARTAIAGPLVVPEPLDGYTDQDGGAWYALAQLLGVSGLSGPGPNGGPGFTTASQITAVGGGSGSSGGGPGIGALAGNLVRVGAAGAGYPYSGGLLIAQTGSQLPRNLLMPSTVYGSPPADAPEGQVSISGASFFAYPMLGIVAGKGAYIWAYAGSDGAVSPATVAGFMAGVVTPSALSTAGGTPPSSSPGTNTSPGTPTPPAAKSGWASLPLWEQISIIAGGSLAVGLVGYGLLEGYIMRQGASRVVIEVPESRTSLLPPAA